MKNRQSRPLIFMIIAFLYSITGYRQHLRKATDSLQVQNDPLESIASPRSAPLKPLKFSLCSNATPQEALTTTLTWPIASLSIIPLFAINLLANAIYIPLTRL